MLPPFSRTAPQRVSLTLASARRSCLHGSPFTPTSPGAGLAPGNRRRAGSPPPTRSRPQDHPARRSTSVPAPNSPAEQADEVLILNERGEVCEGTFTNVFLALPGAPGCSHPAACLRPAARRAAGRAARPACGRRSRAAAGGSRQGRAVRRQLAPGAGCGMPCLSAGGLAGARLSRMRMTAGRERLPPRLRDLGGLLTEWPATEREWQPWRTQTGRFTAKSPARS